MAERSGKSKVISSLFWSYGERFLAQIISLLVSIVLARLLSPEDYGVVAIVMVFITICDALVTGGFGNALVQKKDANDVDFDSICWVSVAVACVLYLLLFLASPFIANFYGNDILVPITRVMGVKFIVSAFNSVQQAYIQREMIFKKFFFATLGGTVMSAVVGITMAYNGFGVWAIVAQNLTNTIINTIILYLTIDWKPKIRISWIAVKDLWGFGSKMLASTITFTLKDNIRSLVIGKQFSSGDLAFYNQGQKFPSLLVTDIVESLGKVLFPVFSQKQEDIVSLKSYMRKSVKLSSYILLPLIIGLFAVADTFIQVILTEKWLPCVPYLRILCVVYMTRPMSTVFQKCVLAIGKSNINLLHEIITSILNIVLMLIAAIGFKSVEMVAWSYVIVMIVGILIYGVAVGRYFKYSITELISDYCPSLIISMIMGGCVYFLGYVSIKPILKLVCQIIVGGGIYILLSSICKMDSYLYLKGYIKPLFKKKLEDIKCSKR